MDYNELGLKPIPGAQPAGSDIRSEEIFEKLSAEIDKMSSPSASGAIDWKKILDISSDILGNRSKDLLVGSYFSLALLKTKGLPGLTTGIHVWRDMLSSYWEDLFPVKKRMRGRRNAVDWWIEKISSAIRDAAPETWEQSVIDTLYGDLDAIDKFLKENMEDAPTIGPLMSIVGSVIAPAEVKKPDIAGPDPAAQTPNPVPKPVSTPAAHPIAKSIDPIPATDDVDTLLKHGIDTLRAASSALMSSGTAGSLYFRLNRTVAWLTVSGLPPNQSGKTMLEAPDDDVRNLLTTMREAGNWKNLLAACESRISQYLFWLDLSRYVAEALEQLGQQSQAKEVTGLTTFYVNRLPGIEKLTFSDGTPFADHITRKWLSDAAKGSSGDGCALSNDSIATRIESDMAAAKTLALEGNFASAAGQLRDALNRAPSIRERFMREIHFCRFLNENNQNKLSGSYLRELVGLIDTYRIGEWEPGLASEAYDIILATIVSPGMPTDDLRDLKQEVFGRLSLIDPVKAMQYT